MDNKQHNPDFIAASDLRNWVIRSLGFFFRCIDRILQTIKRRFAFLLAGLAIGLLAAYGYYINRTHGYQVALVAERTASTDKKALAEVVDHLALPGIFSVEARTMNGVHMANDNGNSLDSQLFRVVVATREKAIPPGLDTTLIAIINSNPYLKKTRDAQLEAQQGRLELINGELSTLDSIQHAYLRLLARARSTSDAAKGRFDPDAVGHQFKLLSDERTRIIQWLIRDRQPVHLIQGFDTPVPYGGASLTKTLVKGALAGFALALLLALLADIRKYIIQFQS